MFLGETLERIANNFMILFVTKSSKIHQTSYVHCCNISNNNSTFHIGFLAILLSGVSSLGV